MALPEIKQISIREYLKNMSVLPKKDFGYYGMYFFRSVKTATQVLKWTTARIYGMTLAQTKVAPLSTL